MTRPTVLDLFSGAAGGWSLGMHRAGFETVAACEVIQWRRALYSVNNPTVRLYDDVRTLTASRLVSDLGYLPDVIVGSPPCQDISSANTKGRGVDGDRSKLFFEAIRLVGDCRPRWCALENSSNLRTRGADRVLGEMEVLGYSAWPFVVGAKHVGANHERLRAWIIAFDPAQVGHGGWRSRRHRAHGNGTAYSARGFVGVVPNSDEAGQAHGSVVAGIRSAQEPDDGRASGRSDAGFAADAYGDRVRFEHRRSEWPGGGISPEFAHDDGNASQDGWREGRQGRCIEPTAGLPVEARGHGPHADEDGEHDRAVHDEMGERPRAGGDAGEPWAEWNGGLASHLRVDARLSAELADTRVALGGGKGVSAASLVVEAFGDAVVPEIPYRIGRAIWRVERALAEVAA